MGPVTFFTLPRELRNKIYTDYFDECYGGDPIDNHNLRSIDPLLKADPTVRVECCEQLFATRAAEDLTLNGAGKIFEEARSCGPQVRNGLRGSIILHNNYNWFPKAEDIMDRILDGLRRYTANTPAEAERQKKPGQQLRMREIFGIDNGREGEILSLTMETQSVKDPREGSPDQDSDWMLLELPDVTETESHYLLEGSGWKVNIRTFIRKSRVIVILRNVSIEGNIGRLDMYAEPQTSQDGRTASKRKSRSTKSGRTQKRGKTSTTS